MEFYFRFWSRPFSVICMSFCITLPKFVQIGAPAAVIWRHFHFWRWRSRPLNTSSGFVFVDGTAFRRFKSINKPISSTYLNWRLIYNYFLFLKNKRLPYWKSTFGFDFDHLPEISTFTIYFFGTSFVWCHNHDGSLNDLCHTCYNTAEGERNRHNSFKQHFYTYFVSFKQDKTRIGGLRYDMIRYNDFTLRPCHAGHPYSRTKQ